MNYCPNCTAVNNPGARFCLNCGKPLGGGMQTIALGGMVQGRYQVQRLLGQGGMGAVYQVLDIRLGGKSLAMKEMSDAALTDPAEKAAAIVAFRHEAELLANLDHPNIPKITDYFNDSGKYYIVMELVQGETLEARLLRQGGPCNESDVCSWAMQLAQVLEYLHGRNPPVIFRDFKPGNIMITPGGQVKLIDFGIARLFKPGQANDTQVMGTKGYAPPEQYGKGQTDVRSDIYSLGVVLHEALTCHDPVTTPFSLPAVRQINPSISQDLENIVARATKTDRAQRYQNVVELQHDLSVGQKTTGTQPTIVIPPQPPSKNRTWVSSMAIVAVIVVLVGGGGILAMQILPRSASGPVVITRIVTPTMNPTLPPTIPATSDPASSLATMAPDTDTPVPTSPKPSPTPKPKVTPDTPTPDWRIEAEAKVRDVVGRYGEIKEDALTFMITDRLPEILTGDLLERQRRGICGMKDAGQYYIYNNRSFDVLQVAFDDQSHARVLAYIEEDRVLHNRDGSVLKDYGHEFYRAIYLLERKTSGRWYIACFDPLDDGPLPPIQNIECSIVVPDKNPCVD